MRLKFVVNHGQLGEITSQIMGKTPQKCRNLCFLMRLRHISYGIVLRCYSEKLLLSFGILNKISYLCEKFRYEKFR